MWWKLFQLSIMAAVMCGNIYWQWSPSPYAVALLGDGRRIRCDLATGLA
jgi:hypothetical protein